MTHTPTATLAATDGATAPATVASTATTATAAATLTRAARSDASPAPAAPRPSQALIPEWPHSPGDTHRRQSSLDGPHE
ncbi:MAG: hypothetical protein IPH95_00950 [Candidatus Promineofilum sp.]|nr:hypothetical protein [Promineifilum sp.]